MFQHVSTIRLVAYRIAQIEQSDRFGDGTWV